MTFLPDEGYYFGLGIFETIGVFGGRIALLEEHLDRMERGAAFLELPFDREAVRREWLDRAEKEDMRRGNRVLKYALSRENALLTVRDNPYRKEDYRRGFRTELSPVRRNETSPLTYHKTFHYGDCLLEKRRMKSAGIDEPIFLNTKGEIAEGASANVFFVKDGELYTPPVSCGLLPGVMREFLLKNYPVRERAIRPGELGEFQEMFLTNSLLGVMPVISLGEVCFLERAVGERIGKEIKEKRE